MESYLSSRLKTIAFAAMVTVLLNQLSPVRADCKALEDICACRKDSNCVFTNDACQAKNNGCKDLKFEDNDCRRKFGVYGVGGALCVIPDAVLGDGPKNCRTLSTALAVNLNGKEYTDFEAVTYQPGSKVKYDDPNGIADVGEIETIRGCLPEDKPMYDTFMRSNSKGPGDKCVTFSVPIKKEGNYEVTLRMADPTSSEPFQRSFVIKFNGIGVVREMDMFSWAKKKAHAMNVRVLFRVSEDIKKLTMMGHKDSVIEGGKIPLSFCTGTCDVADPNFLLTAFRVIEVGKGQVNKG